MSDDGTFTICPHCGYPVDPATDATLVYAKEMVEVTGMGGTARQYTDGIGAYFHPHHWPFPGYREHPRPDARAA